MTFDEFVDMCRVTLGGGYTAVTEWKRETLEAWVSAGIRDYSTRFPRLLNYQLSKLSGQRLYYLQQDCVSIRSIHDNAAGVYLLRRSYLDPNFTDGYYDVIETGDAATDRLMLGETPTAGGVLDVWYGAVHDAEPTTLTVPDGHLDILMLYVIWRASLARREQSLHEPPERRDIFERHQKNLYAARLDYFTALSQARKADEVDPQKWIPDYLRREFIHDS